jgi:hypothetical protein
MSKNDQQIIKNTHKEFFNSVKHELKGELFKGKTGRMQQFEYYK